MRYIYHPFSPYCRKVYVLALELGLADSITLEKVVVAPVPYPGWSDNNLDVSAAGNPLAKIPTLVVDFEGGPVGLFDSKVICEYLLTKAGQLDREGLDERTKWQEKAIHAGCDGLTDAEILVIYEERLREDKQLYYKTWVDGQREKVMRGLDLLERMAKEGVLRKRKHNESISLAEIAAAVTLDFMDLRKVDWRASRNALQQWYESIQGRASFIQAPLGRDVDWKRKGKLA